MSLQDLPSVYDGREGLGHRAWKSAPAAGLRRRSSTPTTRHTSSVWLNYRRVQNQSPCEDPELCRLFARFHGPAARVIELLIEPKDILPSVLVISKAH